MKLTLLLLAFVAVTVNVAYAAPQADTEMQELLKAIQQQDDGGEENENVDIQSLLKGMQDAEDQGDEEAQIEEAALQDFFAREQIPVKLQGWFSRAFKKVRKVVRKVAPYVRHGYRFYKMYRRYRG